MARHRMRGGGMFDDSMYSNTGLSGWVGGLGAMVLIALAISLIIANTTKDRNTSRIASNITNILLVITFVILITGILTLVISFF